MSTTNTPARPIYFDDWAESGYDGMVQDFAGTHWGTGDPNDAPVDVAKPEEVLFADYTYEDYNGSAFVLFSRDGKLYEVNGSHCSCYGLEGQWTPEETTWAALAMRPFDYWYGSADSLLALRELIAANTAAAIPAGHEDAAA